MTLQRREKILAAATGGLTLLLAVWFLFFSGRSLSYAQLRARRDQLAVEVAKKERAVKAADVAVGRLGQWQHRALPSDVAEARVQYHAWLRELVDRLRFQQRTVEPTGLESRPQSSAMLKFTVRGRTDRAKLVEFLHEFYSAGHLHQIRMMDITTVPNSRDLNVNIDVEAMSLPGADRKNQLTDATGTTLQLAKLSDYVEPIVKRDLFSPFRQQRQERREADVAQSTFVTAIVAEDGRGEVWLNDRLTGKNWTLHVGDRLEVGSIQGTVKAIGTQEVLVDLGDRVKRYRFGDSLVASNRPGGFGGPRGMGGMGGRRGFGGMPGGGMPGGMSMPWGGNMPGGARMPFGPNMPGPGGFPGGANMPFGANMPGAPAMPGAASAPALGWPGEENEDPYGG